MIKNNYTTHSHPHMIAHSHFHPNSASVEDSTEFFTDNYETTLAPGLISTALSKNQTDLPTPSSLHGKAASLCRLTSEFESIRLTAEPPEN